jgi:hypothetical protein
LPFPEDLQRFLAAAPLVSRALVSQVKQDEAKKLFGELEQTLENDPTRLLSHALLGALAFGVRRDEYAVIHLHFVATARTDLGEAWYLGAVAAARGKANRRDDDVLAVEALRRATDAGFDWRALGEKEPGLARLRGKADLWKQALPAE